MVEAEEAQELKRALSAQMLQLLLEQEQRLEGYLRECITFDGGGSGPLAPDGDKDSTLDQEPKTNGVLEVERRRDPPIDNGGSVTPSGMSRSSSPDDDVTRSRLRGGGNGRGGAERSFYPPPGGGRRHAEDDDDSGFEKVERWMVEDIGDAGRDSGGRLGAGVRRREREGSLLVPFPSFS